ncbi:hypothetical protein DFH07DRAFT_778117 [Mycena maculata]|uniref:Uncharacterized protein n=1 Tax=Mycena maculata TaxID=230809 RepID=A0AAD7IES6_9AGAR|nr:hypothetical protein DFH07DRAFT_778117 [Mycena maculata]
MPLEVHHSTKRCLNARIHPHPQDPPERGLYSHGKKESNLQQLAVWLQVDCEEVTLRFLQKILTVDTPMDITISSSIHPGGYLGYRLVETRVDSTSFNPVSTQGIAKYHHISMWYIPQLLTSGYTVHSTSFHFYPLVDIFSIPIRHHQRVPDALSTHCRTYSSPEDR